MKKEKEKKKKRKNQNIQYEKKYRGQNVYLQEQAQPVCGHLAHIEGPLQLQPDDALCICEGFCVCIGVDVIAKAALRLRRRALGILRVLVRLCARGQGRHTAIEQAQLLVQTCLPRVASCTCTAIRRHR